MDSDPHIPVLLEAVLEGLALQPDGRYVDGTFGRGGHSRAILSRLGPQGALLAMDRDPAAHEAARRLSDDPRFTFTRERFSRMAETVQQHWPEDGVDGVLLDLGVSSPQLDESSRGFSFQKDGPLDMRMDPGAGAPVSEWLNRADETSIADTLFTLGEERYSRRIARAIVAARRSTPITRTAQLAELVRRAVPRSEPGRHPATRTFQALRILANDELGELRVWLQTIPGVLRPGARAVVISFHSLEDRMVKRAFQGRAETPGTRLPRGLPLEPVATTPPLRVVGKPVRPDPRECARNPRARSAVMRIAEKNP